MTSRTEISTLDELEKIEKLARSAPWAFDGTSRDADFYQPYEGHGERVFGVHSYRQCDVDLVVMARNMLPLLLRVAREAREYVDGLAVPSEDAPDLWAALEALDGDQ